jgi:hypothetical protein
MVAVGAFMGCVAVGLIVSLPVFLHPMSVDAGWSGTGISLAMTLDFVTMGIASFGWGLGGSFMPTVSLVSNGPARPDYRDNAVTGVVPSVRGYPSGAAAGLAGNLLSADHRDLSLPRPKGDGFCSLAHRALHHREATIDFEKVTLMTIWAEFSLDHDETSSTGVGAPEITFGLCPRRTSRLRRACVA